MRSALSGRDALTVRETAKRLCVNPRTVYRMVARGELEAAPIKPHRGMAVTVESVEALLAQLLGGEAS